MRAVIERDVARTFAGAGRFETQAARDKLRRVLGAYAMAVSDRLSIFTTHAYEYTVFVMVHRCNHVSSRWCLGRAGP